MASGAISDLLFVGSKGSVQTPEPQYVASGSTIAHGAADPIRQECGKQQPSQTRPQTVLLDDAIQASLPCGAGSRAK